MNASNHATPGSAVDGFIQLRTILVSIEQLTEDGENAGAAGDLAAVGTVIAEGWVNRLGDLPETADGSGSVRASPMSVAIDRDRLHVVLNTIESLAGRIVESECTGVHDLAWTIQEYAVGLQKHLADVARSPATERRRDAGS